MNHIENKPITERRITMKIEIPLRDLQYLRILVAAGLYPDEDAALKAALGSGIARGTVEVAGYGDHGLPPWRLREPRTSVVVTTDADQARGLKALGESLGLPVAETATVALLLGQDEHDYCGVTEMMAGLLSRLEVYELPGDFVPLSRRRYPLLAELRHGYTNYDELLGYGGLDSLCQQYVENGGVCTYYGEGTGRAWIDCPTLSRLYWDLKMVANEAGEEAYNRWVEHQEKGVQSEIG
jgi:hypothetical protein